ncbi:MAG: SDR family oxidoreductase, partial [Nitrospinaceae bacterium]|nr:SDR family oxidoreductase [Nitrospinaceae bacterium]
IEAPIKEWGKLDILVNNAGNVRANNIANISRADWDSLRRVHMDGMMHTSHFAAQRSQCLACETSAIRIRQTSASALTHIPREQTAPLPPLTAF